MNILHILLIFVVVFAVAAALLFTYAKFFAKQRLQLVADWKLIGLKWSTWLHVIGYSIMAMVYESPDILIKTWDRIPGSMKQAFPERYVMFIGVAVGVLALGATVIQQRKLADIRATIEAARAEVKQ